MENKNVIKEMIISWWDEPATAPAWNWSNGCGLKLEQPIVLSKDLEDGVNDYDQSSVSKHIVSVRYITD